MYKQHFIEDESSTIWRATIKAANYSLGFKTGSGAKLRGRRS